jgi:hypothetical protein
MTKKAGTYHQGILFDILFSRLSLLQDVLQIFLTELAGNSFQIALWINGIFNVSHLFGIKGPDHVEDSIHCLNMTKEGVT